MTTYAKTSAVKLFVSALLLGIMTLSAPTTYAQDAPAWKQNAGEQIATLLESDDASVQARGMHIAMQIAQRHPDVNLKAAVAPLVEIAQNDSAERTRLMAVVALGTIRTEFDTNEMVQVAQQDTSKRVQRAAKATVIAVRSSR